MERRSARCGRVGREGPKFPLTHAETSMHRRDVDFARELRPLPSFAPRGRAEKESKGRY